MKYHSSNVEQQRHSPNYMNCKEGRLSDFNQYICSTCGFGCKARWELVRHQKVAHASTKLFLETKGPLMKNFQCEFCDYSCAMKNDLTRHRRTHTGERPFKCQLCPYSATQYANLVKHDRVHSCGFCGFSSGDKQVLLHHRNNAH